MSYYATQWRESGACVTADPDLFFPISASGRSARQAEQARRICAGCGVRRECLQFAIDSGETSGIWGGTTPEERERARRRRAYARRTAARREESGTAA